MGVKEELLPLISLSGIGRVRARKLYNAGYKKILDLKRVDVLALSRVVGESIARKIKEQISTEEEKKDFNLKENFLRKPREISMREVDDREVETLLSHYEDFELEKEKNKNLFDYF